MNLSTVKWAKWDKTQSRELLVCSYVCASDCAQLLHTILHRTDLTVFPLTLQTITTAPMMSIWGKGGRRHLILIRIKPVYGQRALPCSVLPCNAILMVVYTARPMLAALQTHRFHRCHDSTRATISSRECGSYTLFACLLCFPTYFLFSLLIFPDLSTSLLTFSYENRPEVIRGD